MSFLQPLSSCTVHCELKNPDSKESHFLAIFSRVVYEIQSEKPTIFLQVFYQNTETEFSTNVRCYKYLSKKGKVTTVSSGDYSYYKVNFYRDTSNYYMAQVYEPCVFAQSFREQTKCSTPVLGQCTTGLKGKENICSTLEHFASRSPSLIKLLQTKSIQANWGFHTSLSSQKQHSSKFRNHHAMQTQVFFFTFYSGVRL